MAIPLLIDTDMGVDDAVAVVMALSTDVLELVGVSSVAGNVPLDQATDNIGRLIGTLGTRRVPRIGRGLDQTDANRRDATDVHGADGLGGVDLPVPDDFAPGGFLDLYEQLIDTHGRDLAIVAIGPLTNLAAVLEERPGLLERAGRIVVMGGAIWCPGNVTPNAEFNFYRDPGAAARVMASGLPLTVVPLDVTRQVAIDESHAAHLMRSGTRGGEILAPMIRYPMERENDAPPGTLLIHDALAVGVLIWPEMFIRSKMGLDIVTAGKQAGRCKPRVEKDPARKIGVVISVNALDFLESMMELLCHERFVV